MHYIVIHQDDVGKRGLRARFRRDRLLKEVEPRAQISKQVINNPVVESMGRVVRDLPPFGDQLLPHSPHWCNAHEFSGCPAISFLIEFDQLGTDGSIKSVSTV